MTLAQFDAIAEDWYQRTHRLREVWQSEQNFERAMRAMNLFMEMFDRMRTVGLLYHKLHMPKPPKDFKSAGVMHR